MNNKGFTLIELLGTLVILTLLALITIPVVNNIINDSKDQVEDSNVITILDAAYSWSLDDNNNSTLPVDEDDSIQVTILSLKTGGYLKKDVINADTGQKYDDSCLVTITKHTYNKQKANQNIGDNKRYYSNYLYSFACPE